MGFDFLTWISDLTKREKNEELGVIMVSDHIALTVDEKEKLFEGMFVIFQKPSVSGIHAP